MGADAFYVGEYFVDLRWEGSHLEYNQDPGAPAGGARVRALGMRALVLASL